MSRSIRTPKANNSHLRTVGVVQASHNFLILVIWAIVIEKQRIDMYQSSWTNRKNEKSRDPETQEPMDWKLRNLET